MKFQNIFGLKIAFSKPVKINLNLYQKFKFT